MKLFTTQDTDFAAFLMLNGIRFFECQADPLDKKRVSFVFFDDKQVCRDLERSWVLHDMKKFCSFRKYLLKEVHLSVKGLK
jgi:hypothetical protein